MKKALMLVAYPKIPGTVPRYGMHLCARCDQGQHGGDLPLAWMPILDVSMVRRYGDKPAILEVCSATLCESPNSPVIVLKE
jgi:hypothetical protein